MVYHFVILSDEVDDFRREIDIDAEATFLDFHNAIIKTCKYKAQPRISTQHLNKYLLTCT